MRIATMGTGSIVERFLDAVAQVEGVECAAVYSRKRETGEKLAAGFGVGRVCTDPDEILDDPSIDFVYVALPNSLHYEHARRALERGRHVICEKPFTSTLREAEELIDLARKNDRFLFEGITTLHLPNFHLLRRHLKDIGSIRVVRSSFCQYSRRYDRFREGETPNVFNPAFSGGALMDLNVYNLHFVMGLLGEPEEAYYHPLRHENGIDLAGVLMLRYGGILCECTAGKVVQGENGAEILGEKGRIHVRGSTSTCRSFTVVSDAGEQAYDAQDRDNALYYELTDFRNLFRSGDTAACFELLEQSRAVMKTLHAARLKSGIRFAADE